MTIRTRRVVLADRPVGALGDDTWRIESVDLPDPGAGEFAVAVDYISLDPAMRGWIRDVPSYLPPVQLGETMRAHAVGRVTASDHDEFPVGATVSGFFGVTEHAVSDGAEVEVIEKGDESPSLWLGALGLTGMTAWFGLLDVGRLVDGETVLVSGAAGAVGSVVGQLAKARGCRVIGIAGGPEKCSWLREIGFDGAVDYRSDGLADQIRELAPEGVDVFFDNVGGTVLDAGLVNLRRGARVVMCGAISAYNAETPPEGPRAMRFLIIQRASITGFLVLDYVDRYPEAVEGLREMIRRGTLDPRETVVSGIENFPEALSGLFRGMNTGKLVLQV